MFYSQYFDSLYVSANLILTFTFLCGYLFKNYTQKDMQASGGQVKLGLLGGLLNISLLLYAFSFGNTSTLLDFRFISIITCFYVSGLMAASITAFVTIAFRLIYFGITPSAVLGMVGIISVLIFLFILSFWEDKTAVKGSFKWFFTVTFVLIANIVIYNLTLRALIINPWPTILQYSLGFLIATTAQFLLINYIASSNQIYRKYLLTSNLDFLTQVYNRRYIDLSFTESINQIRGLNISYACMMIDIDFFKNINDSHGHLNGDIVLKQLADLLKSTFRRDDIIGRIGGEEFCILLKNCSLEDARKSAEKVRSLVEKSPFILTSQQTINITVSIGVANYPQSTNDCSSLKELADISLYQAKNSGRNKVVCSIA